MSRYITIIINTHIYETTMARNVNPFCRHERIWYNYCISQTKRVSHKTGHYNELKTRRKIKNYHIVNFIAYGIRIIIHCICCIVFNVFYPFFVGCQCCLMLQLSLKNFSDLFQKAPELIVLFVCTKMEIVKNSYSHKMRGE